MEREPFDARLVVRGRNRWIVGFSTAPAFVALLLMALASLGLLGGTLAPPLAPFVVLSLLGALSVLKRNPAPVLEEVTVRLESDELRIGRVSVPRATIQDAQIVPLLKGQGSVVRIWRTRRLPIDLIVRDKTEGRSVLRALGFDASQRVTRFRGASLVMKNWSVRSGLLLVLFPVLFAFVGYFLQESPEIFVSGSKLLGVLLAATALAMAIPSHVAVGADGVLVTWLGLKWFHPMSRIRRAERFAWGMGGRNRSVGVALTMQGGQVVDLPMGSAQWNDDRAAALHERIHEAMETHARGNVDTAAAMLGRRERGVRDWIQELRAIGVGANADMRTAAVSPESLWGIVESHGAEPAERAAAAVALGASLDDEGKQRLRVAVETVADERLRVAIDAAVREDDAALEEALEEVTGGEARGSAKAGG